jgi:hypothetical protein
MSKIIYILQNTYYSEQDWEVFTSLKKAEEAMQKELSYTNIKHREEEAKKYKILEYIIK